MCTLSTALMLSALIPTPTARDWKDVGDNVNYDKIANKSKLSGVLMMTLEANQRSGMVGNPDYVQRMMGFPDGWLDS